jgi:metallo-beta-lactamase family protein
MATVTSYGATGEVTGSCHVLEVDGVNIMIDCGMFQGEEEEQNQTPFPFKASEIDYVLLTHAHLDHIGRVPKLIKEGFNGKIYATEATQELAYIILLDSAKIMNEDFETKYKKAVRKAVEKKVLPPLYGPIDVQNTFFAEWINPEYDTYYELDEGISFVYRNAGHIIGSAFIEISYMQDGTSHTIVFSGDIGNNNDLILPHLQKCKKAETLYVESTYGDRDHQPIEKTLAEFKDVIKKTLARGGNVLIPSFAVERTQELLYILREMHENRDLPKRCRVYLDSPMASKATDVYNNYSQQLNQECQENIKENGSVFNFDGLFFTDTPEESKAINEISGNAIIIAGSGMCNGGRITRHFKHRIWEPKNAIIFVGYQAEGTLGREIVDGAEWIKLYDEDIIVKASIHTINGFSAHADQDGIIDWISKIKDLKNICLIHGEKESQLRFKEVLDERFKLPVHIVKYKEKITLA